MPTSILSAFIWNVIGQIATLAAFIWYKVIIDPATAYLNLPIFINVVVEILDLNILAIFYINTSILYLFNPLVPWVSKKNIFLIRVFGCTIFVAKIASEALAHVKKEAIYINVILF
jgi:hypothetical protein